MRHSVTIERITPDQAREWLKSNGNNRPLRPRHVEFLAGEMRQGYFMPTTPIHFVITNGKSRLINGQHTLHAVIKGDVSLAAMPIIRTVECSSQEQDMLYMHYDIGLKRSFADTATALSLPETMKVSSRIVTQITTALRFMYGGFGAIGGEARTQLSVSALATHVPKWAREAQLLENILTIDPVLSRKWNEQRQLVLKAPVYSVALITAFSQPNKAKEFWPQVVYDNELSLTDPRKTLHEFLPKTVKRSHWAPSPVTPNLIARAVAQCWNAFYEARPVSKIYVSKSQAYEPIKILGSSFTGNQAPDYFPHRDNE